MVDYEKFLSWAESRFDHVVVSGNEIKINSIFCEDRKHHLWCNPYGGKKEHEGGVYHCWKSGAKGSLIGLVMMVDGCSFSDAAATLDASMGGGLAELEKRVEELFEFGKHRIEKKQSDILHLEMPPDCYLLDDLPSYNKLRSAAESYLNSRLIPLDGLMVCTAGRYRNRVMIPYRDQSGRLVYFNGRHLFPTEKELRYLGPPKEIGIGKGDVLYSRRWPVKGEKVYITEGEFDSMTLDSIGLKSVSLGGKTASRTQMEMIKDCAPVLALDGDIAGTEATPKIAHEMMIFGFKDIRYVRPKFGYKDWNEMLVSIGSSSTLEYITTQEKKYETVMGGDLESISIRISDIFR